MTHIPTKESDVQKVIRIAKELGISLEDAAVTCAGFGLAFSNEGLRRAIFGIIDQLDEEAYKKGEPLGLIISYTVELGAGGIRVGRYADEIPPGVVVHLTPTDRAMIFLKIKDNFPTQQFLGPIIMNRPDLESEPGAIATGVVSSDKSEIPNPKSKIEWRDDSISNVKLPSLDKEGCPVGRGGLSASEKCDTGSEPRAVASGDFSDNRKSKIQNRKCNDGLVCSDSKMKEPAIPLGPSSLEPARVPIPLGPIRLTFHERFRFLSPAVSQSQPGVFIRSADQTALKPPSWAATQAGMPAPQSTSGLSPPYPSENLGHSKIKRCPARPPAINA